MRSVSPLAVRPDRSPLSGLALIAVAGTIGVSGGVVGIAGGLLLVFAAVLPVPFAVAVGHVLLAALYPAGVGLGTVVVVEAGLLVALLTADDALSRSLSTAVVTLVCVGVLVAGTLAMVRVTDALVVAAGVLLLCAAVCSYGLHRYELVAFDLVEADR